jgi:hypothetical protein
MFGINALFMAIADYRARRRNAARTYCDVCSQKFASFEAAEEHRRKMHKDVAV